MPSDRSQIKILAQAIYEIRLLLSGHLGNQNKSDVPVSEAAHLAYALHNEALSIIEGGTFDGERAMAKIKAVDSMFNQNFASRFEAHLSDWSDSSAKMS